MQESRDTESRENMGVEGSGILKEFNYVAPGGDVKKRHLARFNAAHVGGNGEAGTFEAVFEKTPHGAWEKVPLTECEILKEYKNDGQKYRDVVFSRAVELEIPSSNAALAIRFFKATQKVGENGEWVTLDELPFKEPSKIVH